MKKKLVFHFYFGDDWKINPMVKIHLNCLKHYCHIFDEILIVAAVENMEDINNIDEIKSILLKYIKHNRITLAIKKNTPLREAETFYYEVLNKEEEYNGLIFFGHTKGYTNIYDKYDKKAILEWVCGLYFLSLEFHEEAYQKLAYGTTQNNGVCFGSFFQITDNGDLYEYPYSGTFYWININTIKHEKFKIPFLDNRFYAEKFPFDLKDDFYLSSHNNVMIYSNRTFYYEHENVLNVIKFICQYSEDELKKYEEFKKEVLIPLD